MNIEEKFNVMLCDEMQNRMLNAEMTAVSHFGVANIKQKERKTNEFSRYGV